MNFFVSVVLGVSLSLALLIVNLALAQQRYSASADGQAITDNKTSLVWQRCAERMSWKVRTCVGQAVCLTKLMQPPEPKLKPHLAASHGACRL